MKTKILLGDLKKGGKDYSYHCIIMIENEIFEKNRKTHTLLQMIE